MPKTFSADTVSLTIRFPIDVMAWAKAGAEKNGESVNVLIRRIIDDYRSLFGLPKVIAAQIDADAQALGMSRREYLMHLVALRYEQVLEEGPGFEKKASKRR